MILRSSSVERGVDEMRPASFEIVACMRCSRFMDATYYDGCFGVVALEYWMTKR